MDNPTLEKVVKYTRTVRKIVEDVLLDFFDIFSKHMFSSPPPKKKKHNNNIGHLMRYSGLKFCSKLGFVASFV